MDGFIFAGVENKKLIDALTCLFESTMAKDDFKWKCYSVIFNSKYIPLIHVVIGAVAILFLNQIRAKVGVNAPHENFAVVVS